MIYWGQTHRCKNLLCSEVTMVTKPQPCSRHLLTQHWNESKPKISEGGRRNKASKGPKLAMKKHIALPYKPIVDFIHPISEIATLAWFYFQLSVKGFLRFLLFCFALVCCVAGFKKVAPQFQPIRFMLKKSYFVACFSYSMRVLILDLISRLQYHP